MASMDMDSYMEAPAALPAASLQPVSLPPPINSALPAQGMVPVMPANGTANSGSSASGTPQLGGGGVSAPSPSAVNPKERYPKHLAVDFRLVEVRSPALVCDNLTVTHTCFVYHYCLLTFIDRRETERAVCSLSKFTQCFSNPTEQISLSLTLKCMFLKLTKLRYSCHPFLAAQRAGPLRGLPPADGVARGVGPRARRHRRQVRSLRGTGE
jgi:hypothetical protein